ncbi:probable RNA-dependent RNA polymerase 1 [Lotus japonicus]|uniref:probable RNA-dependent RNA polymerase 1 n=1 Tax=Lotus japonicus TaxID=34305 RepID=UPI00258351D4|nr:probable RNA-dependent RNA polymerase 1 [Lotus japonicus]XP_057445085.1 probable RNA-dependent RNA polymerase 1 [Lotus japonicus]XP_057445086.1 probable RNA-dependent RNA polymerase 1 [Lotus japonicus]
MSRTLKIFGFPSHVSPEEVKKFLEQHTGLQTVDAVEFGQQKEDDPWTHVNVQFTNRESVETILLLVSQHLSYSVFTLNAKEIQPDILAKPRSFAYSIDDVVVHFGCQTSKEKLGVLWEHPKVSVQFGARLRKMYIFFHYLSTDYKLQISSESISRIELHQSHGFTNKLLLFQLRGAPQIYEKVNSRSKYFKEPYNNHWFRGVDFTASYCIGQSSAVCFKLPKTTQLPNFRHHYHNYYEVDNILTPERHLGFSSNLNFVPMVIPPEGFNLPYKILFKINSLVQHGLLPFLAIDTNLFHMVDPKRIKVEYIESALHKLYQMKECCYEPVQWLEKQYQRYSQNSQLPVSCAISLDDGLVYVHRVQVTPSRIYFCGPEVNLSNRVLRNYPQDTDNFLRVSFVDEDMDKLHSADLMFTGVKRETKLHQRVLTTLKNGITIGNKKFEFLAFSSSQLRDSSVWMFASRDGLTASDIRKWMGDFHEIRNVAKYAARLGQSFSSSRETVSVGRHEIEMIPDIEFRRGEVNYCFSDGIGKISAELAQIVARKCGFRDHVPSAFQIRYGGFKGVVAIDPSSAIKLSLRKSMCKYKSENTKLDVLAWSKQKSCFLNRQIIILLSTLGVKDRVFRRKQREVVNQIKMISRKPFKAIDMMSHGDITNMLREMLIYGFHPTKEPFLSMMLQTLCASKLQELQLKTRIFVKKGRAMLGCLDETRTLNYGQVFVQISLPRNNVMSSLSSKGNGANKSKYVVKGKVIVAKNPCLHPGDVRILRAVDLPSLHHMVDCVVFPQKGRRPHPNECSGSDLDGDIYFVCWDPGLIPPHQENPMDHEPSQVMNVNLDHDVTLQDVEEHFTHYIVKDTLGVIASAHTVFADTEPKKAMSSSCIELAKLHSIAVDFAKSGVPAEIPQHLRPEKYPDFMEKPHKPSYQSKNIIGQLYREVKNVALQKSLKKRFTRKMAMQLYDHDMEVDGFDKYTTIAFEYKNMYDCKLWNLMEYYGIETEAEIISGNILKMSKSFNERKDLEGVNHAVISLRNEARRWFNEMVMKSYSQGDDDACAIASAWYHVTYHHGYWGCYNEGLNKNHLLSFPWCVHDTLIRIKKGKVSSGTYEIKHWAVLKVFLTLLFCFLCIIWQYAT